LGRLHETAGALGVVLEVHSSVPLHEAGSGGGPDSRHPLKRRYGEMVAAPQERAARILNALSARAEQ
jgi:hypothetical protein